MRTYPHVIKVGGMNLTVVDPTDKTDEEIVAEFLESMGVTNPAAEAARVMNGLSEEEIFKRLSDIALNACETIIQDLLVAGGRPGDVLSILEQVNATLIAFTLKHSSGLRNQLSADEIVNKLSTSVKDLIKLALTDAENAAGSA